MDGFDVDAFRMRLLQSDPLVHDIWNDKYRWKRPDGSSDEDSVWETRERVVRAVYAQDEEHLREGAWAVQQGYLIPAGRVNAGAGTGRNVTLINCYVMPTVQDSMPGIQKAISQGAFTLQQGGGIGTDFSTIRPAGAIVGGVGSVASGAISFMDQQDGMCRTIMSAGTRRGAMMATLRDDHPDLWNEHQYETHIDSNTGDHILTHPSFISAKRQKGRLTGFNVSVLISDAFMDAVENDKWWDLGFHVPPADDNYVDCYPKPFPYDYQSFDNDFREREPKAEHSQWFKGEMLPWFVYRRVKARVIWDDIMRSTYKYAEPGVIYIDRVNQRNNLYYCEDIRTTNPCAEQPLPPNGCCCLSSVNLAFMVDDPFTANARFNYERMEEVTGIGVRFLDNVLSITNYPLKSQYLESMEKRRIGLGITGFHDALIQLGVPYESEEAMNFATNMAKVLKFSSYKASALLAKERGAFPAYDRDKFMESWNVKSLPPLTKELIALHGIRNSVLNTIAPNGTISIYTGNLSSGHEPVFSFAPTTRKVRQPDGQWKEYQSLPYAAALWAAMRPGEEAPKDIFSGAMDLSVADHVRIHAAWQQHIDASISKTINCPTSMNYDAFKAVYEDAFLMGCKGCTTYRYDPESGRGSILSEAPAMIETIRTAEYDLMPEVMPPRRVVDARRYRVKWPSTGQNWYITITRVDSTPFEVFITTSGAEYAEWVQAMSRLLTAVLRRGGDVRFLINELTAVTSAGGGGFIAEQHKYRHSVVAAIGGVLEEEFRTLGLIGGNGEYGTEFQGSKVVPVTVTHGTGPDSCPECGATPLVHELGCVRCLACSFTRC